MTNPHPLCPNLLPLQAKLIAEAAEYRSTLTRFEEEGTRELAESLKAQQTAILTTKEEINELLRPLGYDIDTPPHSVESPDALDHALEARGSRARIDRKIEGGIVSLNITPELKEQLKDFRIALEAYKAADNGSPSWPSTVEETALRDYPYKPITKTSLDIAVIDHGATTPQDRDTLVSHMDTLGYRPLTLAELIALGVLKPELNKRNEVLNTYDPKPLDGDSKAPFFHWRGSRRYLGAYRASYEWGEHGRFLFVCK